MQQDRKKNCQSKSVNYNQLFFCWCILFLLPFVSNAQNLGQDPWTAFPVCGTAKFEQKSVPLKPGRVIPAPCNDIQLEDVNPYYYRFTAYTTGSLGLLITPIGQNEDYDWHIFDITGRDPSEIYTNGSLLVACNWSQEFGPTGTSPAAASLVACGGPTPKWSKLPTITKGHTYLLMVSHFTENQSGYSLEFKGGTASITDPLLPAVSAVQPNCDGSKLNVWFNKKLRCSSLATNGSDFSIDAPGYSVVGATAIQCGSGFDMDSVQVTLNKPLIPGNYSLSVRNGNDGNSLLDYCDRPVDSTTTTAFRMELLVPTPMDSIVTPGCGVQSVELIFRKNINCNSVTSSGSEFKITGPVPVTVTGVSLSCNPGKLTNRIRVNFMAPIGVGGNYILQLVKGSDGNTLLDECGQETPEGSEVYFTMKDTVSAAFSIQQIKGCKIDTFVLSHDGQHLVDSWQWTLPNETVDNRQNPVFQTTSRAAQPIRLIVSNGFCQDTSDQVIPAGEERLRALFNGPSELCPKDGIQFTDASAGPVTSWNWEFGNGSVSSQPNPTMQYYQQPVRDVEVTVRLTINDEIGCTDTAQKKLLLVSSCIIVVPNAFTPNNDGRNDKLFPTNAYKADNLVFRIFNRYGQLVFETRDWTRKWDGRLNGRDLDAGTYVWTLQYRHRDSGRQYALKGTTNLIR